MYVKMSKSLTLIDTLSLAAGDALSAHPATCRRGRRRDTPSHSARPRLSFAARADFRFFITTYVIGELL